jgi:integrase
MGISKLAPSHWFIKARVKLQGEDRRKQERFAGSRADAESRYLELKRELRGERKPVRTFGDLLDAYAALRPELKGSQAYVFRTLKADLSSTDLVDLISALGRYYAILKTSPSKTTGKRLGAASLNRFRTMVAAVLNQAIQAGTLGKSPLNAAIWPKAKEIPRDRFLEPLEEARLLAATEKGAPHLYPIIRFALLVPCRKSELVRMTRADLDLFHNAIRVHNGTTKNDEGSWKPIPPEMVPYFRALPPETPFLFFRMRKGVPVGLGDFKKAWATAKRLAGIRDLHFHDSRHVSATNMVAAGTPERAVMDIAGWKTNMLDTYWKSSSRRALGLAKFSPGRGNDGATSAEGRGNSGLGDSERAVS